jgi:potassium-transporting ATPase KdpC subunit
MRMRSNLITALLMTVATTVLLGVVYPLVVTAIAQAVFRDKANGQLIERNGQVIGSMIIGQGFGGAGYFHGRASAAGNGYDATNSGGTNFGPTNKKLIDSVKTAVESVRRDNRAAAVPIDLVTSSASGLDPHISPDAAMFQVPRVAKARNMSEASLRQVVIEHVEGRQLGFLGEPRVNVLLLNLDLDDMSAQKALTHK